MLYRRSLLSRAFSPQTGVRTPELRSEILLQLLFALALAAPELRDRVWCALAIVLRAFPCPPRLWPVVEAALLCGAVWDAHAENRAAAATVPDEGDAAAAADESEQAVLGSLCARVYAAVSQAAPPPPAPLTSLPTSSPASVSYRSGPAAENDAPSLPRGLERAVLAFYEARPPPPTPLCVASAVIPTEVESGVGFDGGRDGDGATTGPPAGGTGLARPYLDWAVVLQGDSSVASGFPTPGTDRT